MEEKYTPMIENFEDQLNDFSKRVGKLLRGYHLIDSLIDHGETERAMDFIKDETANAKSIYTDMESSGESINMLIDSLDDEMKKSVYYSDEYIKLKNLRNDVESKKNRLLHLEATVSETKDKMANLEKNP